MDKYLPKYIVMDLTNGGIEGVLREGGAEPLPYKLPRKEATSIWISTAPSIAGNRSTATRVYLKTALRCAKC